MKLRGVAYACFAIAVALVAAGAWAARAPAAPEPAPQSDSTSTPANIAATSTATTSAAYYPVVRVIDGDTFVADINGTDTTIRLMGIDTPEVVDPRKPVECFGEQASAEGKQLLTGQKVRLEYDAVAGTTDIYGRTLAYVFLPSGLFYNEYMIANGYAHEYDYDAQKYEYLTEFEAAQASAQAAHLGLWSPQTCNGDTGITSGVSGGQ